MVAKNGGLAVLRGHFELLVGAHDRFLLNPPEKVRAAVEDKLRKFPHRSAAHLMHGLVLEGLGAAKASAAAEASAASAETGRGLPFSIHPAVKRLKKLDPVCIISHH